MPNIKRYLIRLIATLYIVRTLVHVWNVFSRLNVFFRDTGTGRIEKIVVRIAAAITTLFWPVLAVIDFRQRRYAAKQVRRFIDTQIEGDGEWYADWPQDWDDGFNYEQNEAWFASDPDLIQYLNDNCGDPECPVHGGEGPITIDQLDGLWQALFGGTPYEDDEPVDDTPLGSIEEVQALANLFSGEDGDEPLIVLLTWDAPEVSPTEAEVFAQADADDAGSIYPGVTILGPTIPKG